MLVFLFNNIIHYFFFIFSIVSYFHSSSDFLLVFTSRNNYPVGICLFAIKICLNCSLYCLSNKINYIVRVIRTALPKQWVSTMMANLFSFKNSFSCFCFRLLNCIFIPASLTDLKTILFVKSFFKNCIYTTRHHWTNNSNIH